MKKLYVSDLDGTLLNSKREVSERTAEILNQYIDSGGLFTVATARMPYTCDYRLSKVHMNVPAILMNGVMLYDFRKKKCRHYHKIEEKAWKKVLSLAEEDSCNCYLYTYWDDAINLYYESEELNFEGQYYNERAKKGCGYAGRIFSFHLIEGQDVIYIAAAGGRENMMRLQKKLNQVEGIAAAGYVNIYNGGYCLEIYSQKASKAGRAVELKQMLQADGLVSFGDNYNDLQLMEASDECYAPANALEQVKMAADRILKSNKEDGVAEFIRELGAGGFG